MIPYFRLDNVLTVIKGSGLSSVSFSEQVPKTKVLVESDPIPFLNGISGQIGRLQSPRFLNETKDGRVHFSVPIQQELRLETRTRPGTHRAIGYSIGYDDTIFNFTRKSTLRMIDNQPIIADFLGVGETYVNNLEFYLSSRWYLGERIIPTVQISSSGGYVASWDIQHLSHLLEKR
jgi:hypothetical protein